MANVGVLYQDDVVTKHWAQGKNVFGLYIMEIFDHLRLPYEVVHHVQDIDKYDLIIPIIVEEKPQTVQRLIHYVEKGGILVNYGGLESMRNQLGYLPAEQINSGYASLSNEFHQEIPLKFYQAYPWVLIGEENCKEIGFVSVNKEFKNNSKSALQQIKIGNGYIDRWSINIPETIVMLQQGVRPVVEDGNPARDGSANLDEGILKADDGFMLDWELDRESTDSGMKYFAHPYADLWREVIIEHLLTRLLQKGKTLPIVWYWPASVKHIAHISHDSDLNVDESAQLTIDLLKEKDVQSTWCMILPGYNSSIYNQLKQNGHEIAFHYNALESEEGKWGETHFTTQLSTIKKATMEENIISNKNHYTRFEGWGELFEWCEKNGIEIDQTRGPSKKGNIGFLFGTCHPYRPVAWADKKNRFYNVLELGFLTQDLNHHGLADTSIIKPFLDSVKRVNGVAHFLFHQYHIYTQEDVKKAILQLIDTARHHGFTFWTSKQINDWELLRRQISVMELNNEFQVRLDSSKDAEDVVVYIPLTSLQVQSLVATANKKIVKRFGIYCLEEIVSIKNNEKVDIGVN